MHSKPGQLERRLRWLVDAEPLSAEVYSVCFALACALWTYIHPDTRGPWVLVPLIVACIQTACLWHGSMPYRRAAALLSAFYFAWAAACAAIELDAALVGALLAAHSLLSAWVHARLGVKR